MMEPALPQIDLDKCTGCGDCVVQCPTGVVKVTNGKVEVINALGCNYCTECETYCPTDAIKCPFEIIIITDKT